MLNSQVYVRLSNSRLNFHSTKIFSCYFLFSHQKKIRETEYAFTSFSGIPQGDSHPHFLTSLGDRFKKPRCWQLGCFFIFWSLVDFQKIAGAGAYDGSDGLPGSSRRVHRLRGRERRGRDLAFKVSLFQDQIWMNMTIAPACYYSNHQKDSKYSNKTIRNNYELK